MTARSFADSVGRSLVLALVSGLCACSRPPQPPPPANPPPPPDKGATRRVVEDLSGYRQVEQGQKMKQKIQTISAEHDADMSQVLDDRKPPAPPPAE